jgi:hypothetical protein
VGFFSCVLWLRADALCDRHATPVVDDYDHLGIVCAALKWKPGLPGIGEAAMLLQMALDEMKDRLEEERKSISVHRFLTGGNGPAVDKPGLELNSW